MVSVYRRVGRHYEMSRYGQEIAWMHGPHVAEDIFQQVLREARVTVLLGRAPHEKSGVKKNGSSVTEIVMENGDPFAADIFIDRRIARWRLRRDTQAAVHREPLPARRGRQTDAGYSRSS